MKVDPKIRFQKSGFRKNLEEARNYKRQTKKIPETSLGIFLNTVGLGTIWAKIFFALILVFIVYLVFFPNWFTIKTVSYSYGRKQ
jgi:pilus assembly protein TadC